MSIVVITLINSGRMKNKIFTTCQCLLRKHTIKKDEEQEMKEEEKKGGRREER